MCDPLTLGGAALTAISTGMQYAQQNAVQKARDDAMAAERIRQSGFDQQAAALNATAQDRFQNFEQQQGEKATTLKNYFVKQDVPEPNKDMALPVTDSNITVREEQKQRGKAEDFTNRTGEALGQLRSFGDLLGDISRLQSRDAGAIGQIGGFKQGSKAVLPFELEAANAKGAGLGLFGKILGAAGGAGINAGLSGGGFGGGLGGLFGGASPTVYATANVPVPTPRPANLGSYGR